MMRASAETVMIDDLFVEDEHMAAGLGDLPVGLRVEDFDDLSGIVSVESGPQGAAWASHVA